MDKLEEMHKFLEKYNLPKLNQEKKTEIMNGPITSTDIKTVIKNLPIKKKAQGLTVLQVNFTKSIKN